MHIACGNAVRMTSGVTSDAGCELNQRKYFCSNSKGAMWMETKCVVWTAVSKPLSLRPIPALSIIVVKTTVTSLL